MTVNAETKVALFLPSLSGGGAERAMLNLAQGLAERGCAVDLVLARAQGPYLKEVREPIRLVDLKASRVLASLPAFVRYLRREQPEALISALNYANVVAVWARRLAGVPSRVLINEQNTMSRSAPSSPRRRQRMVPYLAKLFYPWADYVIGNSRGVAVDLKRVTGLPVGGRSLDQTEGLSLAPAGLCSSTQNPPSPPDDLGRRSRPPGTGGAGKAAWPGE